MHPILERFTQMCAPYDSSLNARMLSIAKENNIVLHKREYTSVVGPQLETRAEYRYCKIGAVRSE
jgi:purine-nucleoside phosphorylase